MRRRLRPNTRSRSETSRSPVARKMRVVCMSNEPEEAYPIIRFSNIKVHELACEYLHSQLPINNHRVEDKTTASLSMVLYDPNIHFAPCVPVVDPEFLMDLE